MTIVKTCGKLYWAGEYAILEPGQLALIKAIPIYMKAEIKASDDYRLYSDMFTYSVDMRPDSSYALIQETVALVEEYLTSQGVDLRPFSIDIRGKMEREGKKFGLGSSGSVVVLVIKAMLAFYERPVERDLLFKLASAVLLKRGDNGSMGDIACIVSEDMVLYQSFERKKVAEWLEKEDLPTVLARDWGFSIRSVEPALKFDFLVGWTKEPAISSDLIRQIKGVIKEPFLKESQTAVENLEKALHEGNQMVIKTSIQRADQNLKALNPLIYTPALKVLQQATEGLSACAKSSGAGGGDCGIALSFDPVETQTLIDRWKEKNIEVIYQERMGDS